MRNNKMNSNGFLRNILQQFPSVVFSLMFFNWGIFTGITQIQYSTSVLSEFNVANSNHSIDANPATYSELESGTGIIIGIGSYSSHIELQFPTLVPANQTSYVRIETEDNILSSLMGGTLGNLLSGVVGVALTGNQEFTVEIRNGATTVLSGNSANPSSFAGEHLKVVVDVNNHTYLAITPNQSYQSIRITNLVGSLIGLGVKKHMKVWDPYYVIQSPNCVLPKFTSYDAVGISLELLNLGGGVHNLERAIDANLNSHSTLSLGVVSAASNLTQRVYFEGVSQPTDVFAIRLGIDPALLALTLGQGVDVRTQNGANVVTSNPLQNLLTPADISMLLSGQPVTIYVTPNAPVDRVVLMLNGLLGIALSQSLEIYEVYKISQSPFLDVTSSNLSVCEGTTATLAGHAINPTDEIRWYLDSLSTTPIGITASGAPFTTGILHSDTTFYLTSAITGCPNESLRIPVTVSIISGPDSSDIIVPVLPEYCAVNSVTIGASSVLGNNFEWYLDQNASTIISSGQQNGNHTYTIQNDSLTISGLSSLDSPFTVYVSVQDSSTGCWSIAGEYTAVTIVVIDEPAPTASQSEQSFCANQVATIADLQTNGGMVNWYDAPTGGNLLVSTDVLQDSMSYYASTVGAVCESSQRLEILVLINDEAPPVTTDLYQHFCVSDNAAISDLIITGAAINWYDENGNSLPPSTLLVDGGMYVATTQGIQCESSDSLTILVSVSDLPTPTGEATQVFCGTNNPTIDDIVLNETTVVWYDSNGDVIPSGTSLTDSTTYYAALVSATCESAGQFEVHVTFETVPAPTTEDTVQIFCVQSVGSSGFTVGDIDVNEPGIIWYDSAIGGNSIDPSTLLVNGMTYYASQQGSACESDDRLAVTVLIQDLPAPTASDTVQRFCVATPPTISDLQVNESNVVWYNEYGIQMDGTAELADGETYYAVLHNSICQSSDSLAILVIIENQYGAVLDGQFNGVCFTDTIVYSAPSGMDGYQWNVVGGIIVSGGGTAENTVTVVWQNNSITTISVSYQTPDGCTIQMQEVMTVTINVCSDLTITKTVNNQNPFIGAEIIFTITVTNEGQDEFHDIVVDEVIQSGFTYLSYQATTGTYNSALGEWTIPYLGAGETAVLQITVVVNATGNYSNVATIISSGGFYDLNLDNNTSEVVVQPDCLTIYNEISPNGDGVNDYLYIDCIEQFPDNSIIIYNRYGNIVYSATGYQNNWDGVANVSGTIGKGEPLPAGTYFYLLKVEEEDYETSGWIYIVR